MPCCGAPVQRHPVLFVTCSLSGLKDPQVLLFVTTACTFSTPPFSLESSQIKMALVQRQDSLALLWK